MCAERWGDTNKRYHKEIVNLDPEDAQKTSPDEYREDNEVLVKPSWLEEGKYKALTAYVLYEGVKNKQAKLDLILKILKYLDLAEYYEKPDLANILDIDIEQLVDAHYSPREYTLMRRIIEDFRKIYLELAKVIIKAKMLHKDSEKVLLSDVPFLLYTAKEPYLEYLYMKLFFCENATLVDCIDKCLLFYLPVKEKVNSYVY